MRGTSGEKTEHPGQVTRLRESRGCHPDIKSIERLLIMILRQTPVDRGPTFQTPKTRTA